MRPLKFLLKDPTLTSDVNQTLSNLLSQTNKTNKTVTKVSSRVTSIEQQISNTAVASTSAFELPVVTWTPGPTSAPYWSPTNDAVTTTGTVHFNTYADTGWSALAYECDTSSLIFNGGTQFLASNGFELQWGATLGLWSAGGGGLSDNGGGGSIYLGLNNGGWSNSNNYVGFELTKSSGGTTFTIACIVSNTSSHQSFNVSGTFAQNNPITLNIDIVGYQIQWLVGGSVVATATANLPTGVMNIVAELESSAGYIILQMGTISCGLKVPA